MKELPQENANISMQVRKNSQTPLNLCRFSQLLNNPHHHQRTSSCLPLLVPSCSMTQPQYQKSQQTLCNSSIYLQNKNNFCQNKCKMIPNSSICKSRNQTILTNSKHSVHTKSTAQRSSSSSSHTGYCSQVISTYNQSINKQQEKISQSSNIHQTKNTTNKQKIKITLHKPLSFKLFGQSQHQNYQQIKVTRVIGKLRPQKKYKL